MNANFALPMHEIRERLNPILEQIPLPSLSQQMLILTAMTIGVLAASLFHAFPLSIGLALVASSGASLAGFALLQNLSPDLSQATQNIASHVIGLSTGCTFLACFLGCAPSGTLVAFVKQLAVIVIYSSLSGAGIQYYLNAQHPRPPADLDRRD